MFSCFRSSSRNQANELHDLAADPAPAAPQGESTCGKRWMQITFIVSGILFALSVVFVGLTGDVNSSVSMYSGLITFGAAIALLIPLCIYGCCCAD